MKKAEYPLALIVDDDPLQIQILTTVLKKFGITSESVVTAKDFLNKLRLIKPDFCLIDLNIETLGTGFKIIEAVRNVLGPDLNLIIVSMVSDRKAVAHAMEIGANDFIVKPLDRDVLAAKLSYYVSTEELLGAQYSLVPVPAGGASATVYVDLQVREVDEFGITLTGKHLLAKGSSIYLDGDVINQVTDSAKPLLVTVISTWVEEDGSYGAIVEFDHNDHELMTRVRRWLVSYQK